MARGIKPSYLPTIASPTYEVGFEPVTIPMLVPKLTTMLLATRIKVLT